MARRVTSFVLLLLLAAPAVASARTAEDITSRLDPALEIRASRGRGVSRVIIRTVDGLPATRAIKAVAGRPGRYLPRIGQVAIVPDTALLQLAALPGIDAVSLDRRVHGTLERTGTTIGATWVRDKLGFDGSGIGVAIVDSGVANWHDDLGAERVMHFADFVSFVTEPHDDYGHGTHVAGIIAGNGYDSGGARRGVAPGASLVVLKVLDGAGDGFISNVIAAIDYAIDNRARLNIRVLNLSVAAGVYESYSTDPFTLAAKRAVDAGIVVVTSAGNLGKSESGQLQRGGITAPGNAPWVLTVGATNHQRTVGRADDTVAPFSSRGPTNIDHAMKPDIVAPGVGIESLAAAGSTLYAANPASRLGGTVDTASMPYLSMTGTSMAAPVVAGTVALMLEANPALTPNLVKAILQYTAERRARVDMAVQGAGFLNARGAVQLADTLRGSTATPNEADPVTWSRHILWGNERVRGGVLTADGTAWRSDVVWGDAVTPDGERVSWGKTGNGDGTWGAGGGAEAIELEDISEVASFNPLTESDAGLWERGSAPAPWAARAIAAILPVERRWLGIPSDASEVRGY